jgi:hypothetical protein
MKLVYLDDKGIVEITPLGKVEFKFRVYNKGSGETASMMISRKELEDISNTILLALNNTEEK